MERKDLVWLILVSVIIVVIISFIIPIVVQGPEHGTRPVQPQDQRPDQRPPPPPGQEESKHLKTLISFINIGLIIPLFLIYAGIYRSLRTTFTLGLIVVVFAFGMYAVTSNPLLVSLLGGRVENIGMFQIIPDLCATIALIILIRISLE